MTCYKRGIFKLYFYASLLGLFFPEPSNQDERTIQNKALVLNCQDWCDKLKIGSVNQNNSKPGKTQVNQIISLNKVILKFTILFYNVMFYIIYYNIFYIIM